MKRFLSLIFCILSFSFFSVFAQSKEERPKVSVVVPVYKVEPWLRECMDSLVNQTLKEIEIICVDDGTPDNSGKILDEYAQNDSRVKVIHQENGGVQRARNAGLDVATGEYIALVDSDDYVEPNTYETAYNLAKKDDLDILNFGYRRFNDGEDKKTKNKGFSESKVMSVGDYMQKYPKNYVWDNIFKSEIIQKDHIRFVPEIKPADDTCFLFMAFGRAKKVKTISAKFYNYRIMPGTLSRMSHEDVFINSYKMFKHICDSWRSGNCLKDNAHNLITIIIRWSGYYHKISLRYAQEILDSFGADIYNKANVEKCPQYIKDELKKLEYSAKANQNPPLQDGVYYIFTACSGYNKKFTIVNASKKSRANLKQRSGNLGKAQKFKIEKQKEGYYKIESVGSGKMIEVVDSSQKLSADISQKNKNNSSKQNWYIVPCGDGSYNIVSENNLMAMEVKGGTNKDGESIRCGKLNNSSSQKFLFRRVG